MKTKAKFDEWFERRFGPDPRKHMGFDAEKYRRDWIDGLVAQRTLHNLRYEERSLRFGLIDQVTRGEFARVALDAAERWELMYCVGFDTWVATQQKKGP